AKYALAKLGICEPDVRLPITPLDDAAKARIDAALAHAGL
ncbi:MAG: 4-hydroxy-tetrahydrodipicolinate synthase, partial [Pseudomonadota bacterium]